VHDHIYTPVNFEFAEYTVMQISLLRETKEWRFQSACSQC